MTKLKIGLDLLHSSIIGIVGTLITSAIGFSYGSARVALGLSLEFILLIFSLLSIIGIILIFSGRKNIV